MSRPRCSLCGTDDASRAFLAIGTTALCGSCMESLPARLEAVGNEVLAARRLLAAKSAETLELATNEELAEELLRRTTFRGLIVRQKASFKGPCETEWRWDVRNCDLREVLPQILDQAD